jgi:hypothetical protein
MRHDGHEGSFFDVLRIEGFCTVSSFLFLVVLGVVCVPTHRHMKKFATYLGGSQT